MLRFYLREVLAAVAVLAILAIFVAAGLWVTRRPAGKPEIINVRIEGFYGILVEGAVPPNRTLARVRTADGMLHQVRWLPGRARGCRAGDDIKLMKHGSRLRVASQGCTR